MGKGWIGQVNEHPLAVAQRGDPDECPHRLDVAPRLADETPDVAVSELDLDGHGPTSAFKRLHLHLVRLLGERLGYLFDQRAVVDCRPRPPPPPPYLDQPDPPCPNSRPRPALPPRFPTPNCLASFCIASRALRTLLTSAGWSPLPRAIRRRRAPSMISGCALSRLVMDRMTASMRRTSRSAS